MRVVRLPRREEHRQRRDKASEDSRVGDAEAHACGLAHSTYHAH